MPEELHRWTELLKFAGEQVFILFNIDWVAELAYLICSEFNFLRLL